MTALDSPSATLGEALAIGDEEQRQGAFSRAHLATALDRFRSEGYVVLEDALPPSLVEALRREYMAALERKIERFRLPRAEPGERFYRNDRVLFDARPEGGNHDLNRWNMHLPSRRPFLDSQLIANPFAMAIIDALLGDDCVLVTIASDTPYPGSGFQNIHQDDKPFRITINIPLIDVRDCDAPMEIWPRTHRPKPEDPLGGFTTDDHRIDDAEMRRLSTALPSKRLLLKAGSLLIRDQRMMHRGTANRSDVPRPALTLLYFPPPHSLPHRNVINLAARLALVARERARRLRGDFGVGLVDEGNTVGRLIEYRAASDRDFRRRIPADVWEALTPRAARLLRFAEVEEHAPDRTDVPNSAAASLLVLGYLMQLPLGLVKSSARRFRPSV